MLLVIGLGLAALGHPAAAQRIVLDEQKLWGYAEKLYRGGEYFRAISEYRRMLHFFPGGERVAEGNLRIGLALLRGGETAQAIRHFDALEAGPRLSGVLDGIRFLRGLGYLDLERERPYPLREASIASALADLRKISPAWPGRKNVDGFLKALHEAPALPEKSPALAGTLSAIVPGSGSFYVGRHGEGALTLFVTALLIAGAVESFEEDKDGLGVVLGSLGIAFYGGGILAAVSGAHKFNDGHKARYLAEQRQRFGLVIDRGGAAAAFRSSF
ncbi:MAG: hypothetical protein O6934_08080 [SAR324 cluster bacterium]|nr:hypothetical protein [SAR324 cluster bacterium]